MGTFTRIVFIAAALFAVSAILACLVLIILFGGVVILDDQPLNNPFGQQLPRIFFASWFLLWALSGLAFAVSPRLRRAATLW